jgi:hypothetical protein
MTRKKLEEICYKLYFVADLSIYYLNLWTIPSVDLTDGLISADGVSKL